MRGLKMQRRAAVMVALSAALAGAVAQAKAAETEPNGVTLTIIECKATEKTLEVRYRLANDSREDVWICESIHISPFGELGYEVYVPGGSETLIVRRRLNVLGRTSIEFPLSPDTIYRRLPAGDQRSESVILPLPVRRTTIFHFPPDPASTLHATRLRMEIGVHDSSLPNDPGDWLFRLRREGGRVVCHYLGSHAQREQTLSAEADIPRIPYAKEAMGASFSRTGWPQPPDLAGCTRVTVEYQPSMLEYFFPDAEDQSLLSPTEKEYLRSQRTASPGDPAQITALNREIGRGRWSLIVAEESRAKVLCHTGDKVLTSFTVFGDRRLLMDDGMQFAYTAPLTSLASLAPQVESYRLRVQRARVLQRFSHEIRRWCRGAAGANSSGKAVIRYPEASKWNDAIREAYPGIVRVPGTAEPYREGACEYAMNPACEPNSPADMVLLFETHVGWNRHGGPELFTFENYNPRGGLVLLHDGTAKFIRTEGELKQLRWK